jgi:hypothetical protein
MSSPLKLEQTLVAEAPASGRAAKFTRWRPKKWHVMYDQIVALDTIGKSRDEIAKLFGYTPQHVSNIVNCPEAAITRGRLLEQLNARSVEKLSASLETLAVQAKKRLAQVLYDDDLFERSPFAVVDRGLTVLAGVGRLKTKAEASKMNVERAIIFTSDDAKAIQESLKKADIARKLHAEAIEVEAK